MALGARINCIDYLSVKEYRQSKQLDNALQNIDNYNYIVLTSMNGAEIFIKKLRALKVDVRKLCNIKFAVIGSGTAGILENTAFLPILFQRFILLRIWEIFWQIR